ncbi:hypothetical protein HY483_03000 [Candidatus Woesearchaeota archaeon]|nr:hypothetical protein [Candidatus Woesearchaeota archaeon]
MNYADIHMHTSLSDGALTPSETIAMLSILRRGYIAPPFDKFFGDVKYPVSIDSFLERARSISIVGFVDHNTLLSIEPVVRASKDIIGAPKAVVGFEATTRINLPIRGVYSCHVLVYLLPRYGIFPADLNDNNFRNFFQECVDLYGPITRELNEFSNSRFLELGDHVDRVLFSGRGVVTGDKIKEIARRRCESMNIEVSPCICNFSNHDVQIGTIDIGEIIISEGLAQNGGEVRSKYLGRSGVAYLKISEEQGFPLLEDFLSKISLLNGKYVRHVVGIAHPVTLVREEFLASVKNGSSYFDARISSFQCVEKKIREVSELIDFIETRYPYYHHFVLPQHCEESLDLLNIKERLYNKLINAKFSDLAKILGLHESGGSDAHFMATTPLPGIGWGDIDISEIDALDLLKT